MSVFLSRFKQLIMSISYQERRKKRLDEYNTRVAKLKGMQADELMFEYISRKSECMFKKGIFSLFVVAIALSAIFNLWDRFFVFIEKSIRYSLDIQTENPEVARVCFILATSIMLILTVFIIILLLLMARDVKSSEYDLMIIESVQDRH